MMEFIVFLMINVVLSVEATGDGTTEMPSTTTRGHVVFTSCPGPVWVSITSNDSTKAANWQEPVALHADHIQSDRQSGDEFPIGTWGVNYTATGFNGSVAECLFAVVVTDNQPPYFVGCSKTIDIEVPRYQNTVAAEWTPPTAIDNSNFAGTVSTTSARSPGDLFQYGATTVTYYATDGDCNEGSCDIIINVFWSSFNFAVPNIADCPDDIEVLLDSDNSPTATVTWAPPTATMSSSHPEPDVVSNIQPGDEFPLGITIVEYVASVFSFNKMRYNLCTFTVRVLDRYPTQLIERIDPDPVPTILGLPTATVTWQEPVFEDQSDFTVSKSWPSPTGDFWIGTTNINYNTNDDNCNTNDPSATIVITVYDWEDPIISSCPANQTTETAAGESRRRVYYSTPDIFDNSGSYEVSWSKKSGTWFSIGLREVMLTATDASGNEDECSFYVKVFDYEPPTMICPDETVPTSVGLATGIAPFNDLDITDNSNLEVDVELSHASGSVFPLGSTTVYVNGTDPFGNFADCNFEVTVVDLEAPVFTGCPSTIIAAADEGVNTHTVDWVPPTATDNTDPDPDITTDVEPGTSFIIGDNPVTYQAIDTYNNIGVCWFIVSIYDDQPPIITDCPENQTLPTDHRMPTGVTTWSDATLFDNSMRPIDFWWSTPKNSEFVIGTTPMLLTARDESGNEATCDFYINVYDDEPPVLTCLDVTVPNDYRLPSAVVVWPDPDATDNSGLVVTLTPSISSGSSFSLGDTTVDYNGLDPFGNSEDCSFVVTVEDTESPYFDFCPDDISNIADLGLPTHSVVWEDPVAMDNSGNDPHVVSNFNPGDVFSLGFTTVVYKATDNDNNPNETCLLIIEIIDDQPPIITDCPENQTLPTDHRMPTGVTTWSDATLFDNSMIPIDFWWSTPKNSEFVIGTTPMLLTARDESGNEATCDFHINVYDDEPPVLTCLDVTVPNDYRLPSAVVVWPDPDVTDNSGLVVMLTPSISSGSNFTLGQTTVNYDGADTFNNIDSCSFMVTVEDVESPYFTYCPGDFSNSTDPLLRTHSVVWLDPVAMDNSGNDPHVVSNYNPGDLFSLGFTTVVYKATDDDNNPNETCLFNVEIIDYESPIISNCPENTSLPTDYRLPTRETTWNDVVLFDNSLGAIASWWNIANGSILSIGPETHVFLTATDESENYAICEFYIFIYDDEQPMLTCPEVLPVPNIYRLPSAIASWPDPVATDNSGLTVVLTSSIASGGTFFLGETVVDYNGTDIFGNIGTCSFVVTIEDVESPYFTYCPGNFSNSTDPLLRTHSVVWPDPVAMDNSGNDPHVVSNYNPGDLFSLGFTTVVYKATDDDNNPNETCSFIIEIIDYEPPIIYNCPYNISLPTDYRMPTRNTTWNDVILFDNSLGDIDFWWNRVNGSVFVIGSTRVFLTARDEAGNEDICEFYIDIYDEEVPQFTYCPGDIYLSTPEGEFDAVAVWNLSTAIDNSGMVPLVEGSRQPPERFGIGISIVTYTATDNFTNINTCSFKIYVFDNENPQFITCPSDIIDFNEFRRDGAVLTWTEPIVFDNSLSDLIVTPSYVSGYYFTLGLTLVEYKAIDNNNNTAFCYFNVTVIDNEKPIFQNCPTNFSQNTDYRLPYGVVLWDPPTSEDNSGNEPNVTSNYHPGDTFPIGRYAITYWSVDLDDNVEMCTFHLHVFDDEPPVFTFCPPDIVLNPMFFLPSAVANWSQPTSEDNSLTVECIISNYNSSDVFPIGKTTVIYLAFDRANNFETCSFNITVVDIAPPIWYNCSDNFIVTTDFRRPDVNISFVVPFAIDDSGYSPDVWSNYNPGDILLMGYTDVIYQATDPFQNSAVCTFSITVIDVEPPHFIDCPIDFEFFVDDTEYFGFPSWHVPNVTDNSGMPPMVTASHEPFDAFIVNRTLVNYTSSDDDDNIATCQFYINVLHAFNYLQDLNFENATAEQVQAIVYVSVTAVENSEGRKLNQQEEEILILALDVLLQDAPEQRDKETSKNQVVGATRISEALIQPIQKQPLEMQLEIIISVEEIFLARTPEVLSNITFTYESTDVAVSIHPVDLGDDDWFNFYRENSKLQSKNSKSKISDDASQAWVRMSSNSFSDDDDEKFSLMLSYFDRDVFKSSSADETVDYIALQSGDKTTYRLSSGLLACKLMGNTTRYSTEIEFSMVVDIEDDLLELAEEAVCVSWNDDTKRWNRDGCQRLSSGSSTIVDCYCSHTTIFGILLPTELKDESGLYAIMLRVVTYSIGLLSIVCLVLVAYIMLHKRKHQIPFDAERTAVMANLIIASLLMTICYLCTLELGGITLACIIAGSVLEYLYIAMIMWIFVDVFNLFSKLYNIKSMHTRLYHLALGWGFSAFVTFLFFGTYRGYDDSEGCWTDMEVGVIAAFATPTLLIVLTSIIMLLVCRTCKTKLKGKRRENYIMQTRGITRCILIFLPLFLAMWTLSIQVSESDVYRMLFFGIFALHGVFIACYCYYNFRYVQKARTPIVHMVEEKDDHGGEINDDINAADNEAIMKPGSVATVDGYDEIDMAIENQLSTKSNSSLQSSRALLSQQNASTSSIKIADTLASLDTESPREEPVLPLPGAVDDPDEIHDVVDESNTDNKGDQSSSDSSDEDSENEDTNTGDKNEDSDESSDDDEKSEKEASSSDSESETENQEKSKDSSDDDDDDDEEDDNDDKKVDDTSL